MKIELLANLMAVEWVPVRKFESSSLLYDFISMTNEPEKEVS